MAKKTGGILAKQASDFSVIILIKAFDFFYYFELDKPLSNNEVLAFLNDFLAASGVGVGG